MDIAYILGTGSKHDNMELRFSLRSVEKCLTFDRLFVIGSDPGFLSDEVVFVPNEPVQKPNNKAWAIKEQLLKVCSTDISDDFISLNDDYFFLKPVTDFPYPYKGTLTEALDVLYTGDYYRHILATEQWLLKQKLPVKHFDLHLPIVYNKHKLREVIKGFDWESVPYGPEMKSLYCNTLGITGEYRKDVKPFKKENWETFCLGKEMFTVDDETIDRKLWDYLLLLYPGKSKFEK